MLQVARHYRTRKGISAAVTAAALVAACGSPSSPSAPSPSGGSSAPPPSPTATVTLTSSGITPFEVVVIVGGRVTFVNNDVIPHDIKGGPEPSRPDCPEIDAVGFLTPGQQRETQPFPVARKCEYHDHGTDHTTHAYNGLITIR